MQGACIIVSDQPRGHRVRAVAVPSFAVVHGSRCVCVCVCVRVRVRVRVDVSRIFAGAAPGATPGAKLFL